ncbi:MAG: patatin-like phospholipase family protein [Senegalia sp. (in: firmicutes)]|uniref:patatin-like phospholipase family protein n=1 Tax=Senegalia sp. (in: firmicutes) TaxID=1924098 RepID=UPI003F98C3BF
MKNKNINALVVEGGAMRGIFAAGVLDSFLMENFNPFDMCIGVSAGATTLSGYLSNMYERNMNVYTKYSTREEFINIKRFLQGGDLLDLDWLWDISIKELELDIETIINYKGKYLVGVTNIKTGKIEYIEPTINNISKVVKASSAIPVVYRSPVEIDGVKYADGGIADPIPVKSAYDRGANNIMVIRSRPKDYKMNLSKSYYLSKIVLRDYPNLISAIGNRANVYNSSIDFIRNHPKDVNILEVNPSIDFKTTRFTTDVDILKEDYKRGLEAGKQAIITWYEAPEKNVSFNIEN